MHNRACFWKPFGSERVKIFPSQQNSWLLRVKHTLCVTDNVNRHLLQKMKKICVKEICKILEIYGWTFFPKKDFSLLESCQLYIIAKYKASNCFKTDAVVQMCSGKKVFLKILKNSQENCLCARVSFLIMLQAWGPQI